MSYITTTFVDMPRPYFSEEWFTSDVPTQVLKHNTTNKREGKTMCPAEPILPGMRICLNPEGLRYKRLNEIVKGTGGNVIKYGNCSYNNIVKMWKDKREDLLEVIAVFDYDRERFHYLNIKEILPISNTPSIDVQICFFEDDSVCYVYDDKSSKTIEKKVIYQQNNITAIYICDEGWRKQTLEKINE